MCNIVNFECTAWVDVNPSGDGPRVNKGECHWSSKLTLKRMSRVTALARRLRSMNTKVLYRAILQWKEPFVRCCYGLTLASVVRSHILKNYRAKLYQIWWLPGIYQTSNYIILMTKEGSTKIVNFMTPGAGVLVLGRGHISHMVKMHYFFKHFRLYTQT